MSSCFDPFQFHPSTNYHYKHSHKACQRLFLGLWSYSSPRFVFPRIEDRLNDVKNPWSWEPSSATKLNSFVTSSHRSFVAHYRTEVLTHGNHYPCDLLIFYITPSVKVQETSTNGLNVQFSINIMIWLGASFMRWNVGYELKGRKYSRIKLK